MIRLTRQQRRGLQAFSRMLAKGGDGRDVKIVTMVEAAGVVQDPSKRAIEADRIGSLLAERPDAAKEAAEIRAAYFSTPPVDDAASPDGDADAAPEMMRRIAYPLRAPARGGRFGANDVATAATPAPLEQDTKQPPVGRVDDDGKRSVAEMELASQVLVAAARINPDLAGELAAASRDLQRMRTSAVRRLVDLLERGQRTVGVGDAVQMRRDARLDRIFQRCHSEGLDFSRAPTLLASFDHRKRDEPHGHRHANAVDDTIAALLREQGKDPQVRS